MIYYLWRIAGNFLSHSNEAVSALLPASHPDIIAWHVPSLIW